MSPTVFKEGKYRFYFFSKEEPRIHNSEHGFWILLSGKEYFLPFEKYPWFKDVKVSSIINVKLFHNHHLYWPDLDIDLSTEILDNPEKYPLTYK